MNNKKVSFHENKLDNNTPNTPTTGIFSKLKRKTDITTSTSTNTMNVEFTLKIIKENQEQLKNTCNQILELLQHKNIA
jgi:hypothetical protein